MKGVNRIWDLTIVGLFSIIIPCSCNTSNKQNPADVIMSQAQDTTKQVTDPAQIPKEISEIIDTARVSHGKTKNKFHLPLTLIVNNLASPTGTIIVRVYTRKNKFLNEHDPFKYYEFKPNGSNSVKRITDLNYGEFAMAIYQDVNSDGKINLNLIGMPTEPYAFSNNFKPKLKAPVFDECRFDYNAHNDTVVISLLK